MKNRLFFAGKRMAPNKGSVCVGTDRSRSLVRLVTCPASNGFEQQQRSMSGPVPLLGILLVCRSTPWSNAVRKIDNCRYTDFDSIANTKTNRMIPSLHHPYTIPLQSTNVNSWVILNSPAMKPNWPLSWISNRSNKETGCKAESHDRNLQ